MNIMEGFGLYDPEVVCMDVVSTNTVSRLAVKLWLFFPFMWTAHFPNYSFWILFGKIYFKKKSSTANGVLHSGYILFFDTSDTDSPHVDSLLLQDGIWLILLQNLLTDSKLNSLQYCCSLMVTWWCLPTMSFPWKVDS